MKSAEEWAKEWLGKDYNADTTLVWIFQQIQLDAHKAGMTEAAEICLIQIKDLECDDCQSCIAHKNDHASIVSARDNKKEL